MVINLLQVAEKMCNYFRPLDQQVCYQLLEAGLWWRGSFLRHGGPRRAECTSTGINLLNCFKSSEDIIQKLIRQKQILTSLCITYVFQPFHSTLLSALLWFYCMFAPRYLIWFWFNLYPKKIPFVGQFKDFSLFPYLLNLSSSFECWCRSHFPECV